MDREARVSLDAYRCLYAERDVTMIGGVTVLRGNAAPMSPMLNQIVGLGVDKPATEAVLDAALEAMGGWMSSGRDVEPVDRGPTALRLVRVGAAEAQDFGRIVATGYGLPAAVVPWAAQAPSLGWDCWLALDGDEPAAAAGLFMAE